MLGAVLDEMKRMFTPDKRAMTEHRVERPQHLHIGVEIYASVMIDGMKTHKVGGKCPFALGNGFAHEYVVDVGYALQVPFHYGVVGHMSLPGVDAGLYVG